MPELHDFLILCKWPNCTDLVTQEDLDHHQQLCERRIRPCRWMNCKELVAQCDLLAHEMNCIRRDETEYVCYFLRCYWRGGNRNLLHHLNQNHMDMLIQEPEVAGSASIGSKWLTWYIYIYDELFRFGFGYYDEGDIYYHCLYIGPEVIGEQFDVEFEIINVETGEKMLITEDTARVQPVHLSKQQVKKFAVNDTVTYRFKIINKNLIEEEQGACGGGAPEEGAKVDIAEVAV